MGYYLGLTTTRKVAPFPGQDKVRGELAVKERLASIGIEAFAPVRIDFIRQGKRRRPDPIESILLPGYVFADIPTHLHYRAHEVEGLSRTLMAVTDREVEQTVKPFLARAEAKLHEAHRIIEANDRAAMCEYSPGDTLEILAGPFTDRAVKFRRMVHDAHELHPMIEGEMDIFGGVQSVKIDPLDVRRYGT